MREVSPFSHILEKVNVYWLKILDMSGARYVKSCYLMLKSLDDNGKRNWVSMVRVLLFTYGFGSVWMQQGVGDKVSFLNEFFVRLRDCHCQDWHRSIRNSSKLSIYCTYKSMLEPEKYLDFVDIFKYRVALTKFRVSSHKLEIERGRYENILLESRICKYCESHGDTVIEDEYHFLLFCPLYADIRRQYLSQVTTTYSFENFVCIMSSSCKQTIVRLSQYIYQANKIRNDYDILRSL